MWKIIVAAIVMLVIWSNYKMNRRATKEAAKKYIEENQPSQSNEEDN